MSKTRFEARGWHAYAEEDSFEHGCSFEGANDSEKCGGKIFGGATIKECLTACAEFAGASLDSGCAWEDEPGRVDFCRMENADAYEPTTAETEAWKAGKTRLWYVTYTFYIERVTREPVDVERFIASGLERV